MISFFLSFSSFSERSIKVPLSRQDEDVITTHKFVTFAARANDIRRKVMEDGRVQFTRAILRLKIGRRNKRFWRRIPKSRASRMKISISLVTGSLETSSSKFLKTFSIPTGKAKQFSINLGPHLSSLSELMFSNDNKLAFQITVSLVGRRNHNEQLNKYKLKDDAAYNRKSIDDDIKSRLPRRAERAHKNSKRRFKGKRRFFKKKNHQVKKMLSTSRRPIIGIVPKLLTTVLQTKPGLQRDRRSPEGCISSGVCRLKQIDLTMEEIGLGWVFSPRNFTAFYCDGGCMNSQRSFGSFTSIKRKLHEKDPSRIPAPSCTPRSFQPLRVVYINESTFPIELEFPNMIVTDCTCV